MGNPARREGALEQVRVGGARSRGAGGARWGTQPGGREGGRRHGGDWAEQWCVLISCVVSFFLHFFNFYESNHVSL